jgi:hypothetical protein
MNLAEEHVCIIIYHILPCCNSRSHTWDHEWKQGERIHYSASDLQKEAWFFPNINPLNFKIQQLTKRGKIRDQLYTIINTRQLLQTLAALPNKLPTEIKTQQKYTKRLWDN